MNSAPTGIGKKSRRGGACLHPMKRRAKINFAPTRQQKKGSRNKCIDEEIP